MEYVILILFLLAAFHFVYNGIVLPTLRFHLRNKLFAVRDEIRNLKIERRDKCDAAAFKLLHDGINNYLPRLHMLTLSFQVDFQRQYANDQSFRKRVDERRKVIENCSDHDFKQIAKEANEILEWTFVANMGGWFVYVVPIALLVGSVFKLSELATRVIATNSEDIGRMAVAAETV